VVGSSGHARVSLSVVKWIALRVYSTPLRRAMDATLKKREPR